MAEDFEFGDGTFVSSGLKGRSSEPSFEAVEVTEPTPEEQERSDDFPRSHSTVSFPKQEVKAWPERPHFGSESAGVVQEKQEAKEEKVVAPTDVVAKMKCDVGDGMVGQSVSPPVNEKGKGLENYEVDFSGNQGFGEMEKSSVEEVKISPIVEDWNTGLATSCVPFDKNDSRYFLRSNSEQRLNEPFVESILHDAVQTREEPHNFCTDEKQSVFEGLHKMAENDKGNDGAGNCSLKIEVIDETAVIETNSAPNFGSSEGNVGFAKHSEGIDHKSIMKQETHARKEKRPRRRGKGVKNISESDPMKQIPNHTVESLISCKKKSNESKRTYSREELVAMRSVNLEKQRKKLIEAYSGLKPTVAREYDGLVGCNRQKHIQVNFDPRKQLPKKEKAPGLLGPFEITTRWTMVMRFILLPWKPELIFTGTSIMVINPETEKFCSHVDYWDSIENNDYFSLEGLWDVFKQLRIYKTPDLESPRYEILKRTANYEVWWLHMEEGTI